MTIGSGHDYECLPNKFKKPPNRFIIGGNKINSSEGTLRCVPEYYISSQIWIKLIL